MRHTIEEDKLKRKIEKERQRRDDREIQYEEFIAMEIEEEIRQVAKSNGE